MRHDQLQSLAVQEASASAGRDGGVRAVVEEIEVQIGQPTKAKWFKPVAEILAVVYRLRRGAA